MLTKISIILPNLKFGGVEKMRLLLAQSWIKEGYRVEVVLMRKVGELVTAYQDGANPVLIHELGVDRISLAILPLARYLRQSKPDIVLTAMWPLTTVSVIAWLIAGRPGRLYLSEHTHLSVARVSELRSSLMFIKATIYLSYYFAHGIIAVSQGVKDDLVKTFSIGVDRIRVIYNPAGTNRFSESRTGLSRRCSDCSEPFNILTVGELKDSKKHDLLIRAFANLPSTFSCNLYIVGEGELRSSLEKLIVELGLQGRVFLPGFFLDVSEWYQKAHLFVLSSGWEGFGNVIVEAMSFGVPVVSTDCLSGPREILMNGLYGKLVPCGSVGSLSSAMEESLWQFHDTDALIRRSQDFSVERIADQYLDYFALPRHAD
jgi:glycosyltransferase involved in cell wall biosynthesis